MSAEELLAVASLFIAVFAVLPTERRREITLRMSWIDWAVVATSVLVVHYITFFPVFEHAHLALPLGPWRWGFTAESASYLMLVGAAAWVIGRSHWRTLPAGRTSEFRALAERLLHEGKALDLIYLLERHLDGLSRTYENRFVAERVRESLLRPSMSMTGASRISGEAVAALRTAILESDTDGSAESELGSSDSLHALLREHGSELEEPVVPWYRRVLRWIAHRLPSHEDDSAEAQHAVRRILLSEAFVEELARVRPYFALDLLAKPFRERFDFQELFIRMLLKDSGSILYYEIRNNQNLSGRYRYAIPDTNRLLLFYLKDARVAEEYSIYKPFGDAAERELDERHALGLADRYRQPFGDFDEDRWKSELYVTIRFFDLMVLEALHQNVGWHMWLYYMPPIAEKIVRNMSTPHHVVDDGKEWPTPYHFFLYHIVDALCGWIEAVRDVPLDQANVVLRVANEEHENDNIPKSAIIALSQTLRYILVAPSVSVRFKRYLVALVFQRYFALRAVRGYEPYAAAMLAALRSAERWTSQGGSLYASALLQLFQHIDLIPYEADHVREVLEALEAEAAERPR